MIKVFKFGGASIKDADSIRNMESILKQFMDDQLIVVVSAMGKTTNLLELILHGARENQGEFESLFDQLTDFHLNIAKSLFVSDQNLVFQYLSETLNELRKKLFQPDLQANFDQHYDACVSYGELLSTLILHEYFQQQKLLFSLVDARDVIVTNNNYRAANVDWRTTEYNILNQAKAHTGNILTQGFVAANNEGYTTTLGREGSDFSASIFANCLNASELTIWKDVNGLRNADPKLFTNTVQLLSISYSEAIELAYYGATIIHPKTIKPLQNKQIPLFIRSFIHPDEDPSVISALSANDHLTASYIVKENQVLMSLVNRDFSFMNENLIHFLFGIFSSHQISIHVIQNSAISLSICFDHHPEKLKKLIEKIHTLFTIKYNENLSLLTIRHYSQGCIPEWVNHREVLLEQRSRTTLQLVLK